MITARACLARPLAALALLAASCAPAETAQAPRVEPPPAPAMSAPTPPACPTAPAASPPDPAALAPKSFDPDAIDRYLAHEVKEKGLVGLQVALLRGGKVVLAKGYGKSAAAADGAVDNETAFAIGSVTKQFTCAATLLLADDGKLKVTDKVARYYPDLTRARDITLHDLLTHVSGYPDYYPLDFVDRAMARPIAPDALIDRFARRKLDFEPGTRWSYSNTGFVIAGRVVEKIAREPLGSFLARRVFGPLGMNRTRLAAERGPAGKGIATGHASFALGAPEVAEPEGDGWLHGAAGVYSTAEDLARWDLALMDGKILKPRTRDLMLTPRRLADGSTRGYACGIAVSQRRGEPVLAQRRGERVPGVQPGDPAHAIGGDPALQQRVRALPVAARGARRARAQGRGARGHGRPHGGGAGARRGRAPDRRADAGRRDRPQLARRGVLALPEPGAGERRRRASEGAR
jgi:CubicO group peptidase (beta-lactamase class C family)